jgi:putative oxidoreductase
MHRLCSTLDRGRPAAPLVLRVVLGGLFIWHGVDKFDAGISMVEEMFTMWGVPAPGLAALLVAIAEIVGGIALVLGLATRVAAMLLSVVMLGALIYVKCVGGGCRGVDRCSVAISGVEVDRHGERQQDVRPMFDPRGTRRADAVERSRESGEQHVFVPLDL